MTKLDDVLSNVDANLDAALERLFAILRIKSISTDPAYAAECMSNAEWHVADLKSIGFDAAVHPTPGPPWSWRTTAARPAPRRCSTAITMCSRWILSISGIVIPSILRSRRCPTALR